MGFPDNLGKWLMVMPSTEIINMVERLIVASSVYKFLTFFYRVLSHFSLSLAFT